MKATLSAEETKEFIEQGEINTLVDRIKGWQPSDVAALIDEIPEEDQYRVFTSLPTELTAECFDFFDISTKKRLINSFGRVQLTDILNRMSPDDRTALFEELPAPEVTEMITLLIPSERTVALTLLGYPDDSIGRLMTPDYIAVKAHWSVEQVLRYIRRKGRDSETMNVIYVIDDEGLLVDDIKVREFLLAEPEVLVSDLMDSKYVALNAMDDQETAIAEFKRNNRVALPAVNPKGVLVGIVTIDDVLTVAEEENTEDIQKIGGVEAFDDPYLEMPIISLFKKRVVWLVILFIGEMFTATAMGFFEKEIARAIVLSLFIPLIISSGGNTGSQASTLIIRAMALGEVTLLDWWRVMRRELISGLMLGTVLGIIGFTRIALWSSFSNMYGPHWMLLAITVSISLLGVVLWGTITGSMLPLILKKAGVDPATSSAPFVATLVDVTGLVIYFSIASMVMRGTLL